MTSQPAHTKRLREEFVALNFWEHIGWGGSRRASFRYAGPSIVRVSFSYDVRQELGDYRAIVPVERLERAQEILRASDYLNIATPEFVPPDTKSISFEEERAGVADADRRLKGFTSYEVPPRVQPAVDALRELLEWVRQYPRHVIRGAAWWSKAEVSPQDELRLQVALQSVGDQPAEIGSPLASSSRPKGTMLLVLVPDGGSESHIELGEDNLRLVGESKRGDVIKLAPQESWKVEIRKAMYLSPGRYKARVIYKSFLKTTYPDGAEVTGDLPMMLPDLLVKLK